MGRLVDRLKRAVETQRRMALRTSVEESFRNGGKPDLRKSDVNGLRIDVALAITGQIASVAPKPDGQTG